MTGWRDRSLHTSSESHLEFFHYDFYSQALSKIERFHTRDQSDVQQMLATGLVQRERLWQLFESIEPRLIRYPAVDATSFRQRVNTIITPH